MEQSISDQWQITNICRGPGYGLNKRVQVFTEHARRAAGYPLRSTRGNDTVTQDQAALAFKVQGWCLVYGTCEGAKVPFHCTAAVLGNRYRTHSSRLLATVASSYSPYQFQLLASYRCSFFTL